MGQIVAKASRYDGLRLCLLDADGRCVHEIHDATSILRMLEGRTATAVPPSHPIRLRVGPRRNDPRNPHDTHRTSANVLFDARANDDDVAKYRFWLHPRTDPECADEAAGAPPTTAGFRTLPVETTGLIQAHLPAVDRTAYRAVCAAMRWPSDSPHPDLHIEHLGVAGPFPHARFYIVKLDHRYMFPPETAATLPTYPPMGRPSVLLTGPSDPCAGASVTPQSVARLVWWLRGVDSATTPRSVVLLLQNGGTVEVPALHEVMAASSPTRLVARHQQAWRTADHDAAFPSSMRSLDVDAALVAASRSVPIVTERLALCFAAADVPSAWEGMRRLVAAANPDHLELRLHLPAPLPWMYNSSQGSLIFDGKVQTRNTTVVLDRTTDGTHAPYLAVLVPIAGDTHTLAIPFAQNVTGMTATGLFVEEYLGVVLKTNLSGYRSPQWHYAASSSSSLVLAVGGGEENITDTDRWKQVAVLVAAVVRAHRFAHASQPSASFLWPRLVVILSREQEQAVTEAEDEAEAQPQPQRRRTSTDTPVQARTAARERVQTRTLEGMRGGVRGEWPSQPGLSQDERHEGETVIASMRIQRRPRHRCTDALTSAHVAELLGDDDA